MPLSTVHRQNWTGGNSIWGNPSTYVVYDRDDPTVTPPDTNGPAPNYDNLAHTEGVQAVADDDAPGGGYLTICSAAAGGEYRFAAWHERLFGPELGNYWNVTEAQVSVWIRHTAASLAQTGLNGLPIWLPRQGGSTGRGFELRWINTAGVYTYRLLDVNVCDETSGTIDITGWQDTWKRFSYAWVASSDDATADGSFTISVDGVTIVSFTNIIFVPFIDDGYGTNIAPGFAFGYAGLVGDHADAVIMTGRNTPGQDYSTPCCADEDPQGDTPGGGAGATPEDPTVELPDLTFECLGLGEVPLGTLPVTPADDWLHA